MKFYFVNPALHFFLIHYKIIIIKKKGVFRYEENHKRTFFKLITAIATVAGILYVARDQIKAIIAKIKEVSDDDFDDDFDDESFDDDSFDDDEIFPEPSKDDRDYVSINITDTDDDPSVAEEETQETETPSEESDEKE